MKLGKHIKITLGICLSILLFSIGIGIGSGTSPLKSKKNIEKVEESSKEKTEEIVGKADEEKSREGKQNIKIIMENEVKEIALEDYIADGANSEMYLQPEDIAKLLDVEVKKNIFSNKYTFKKEGKVKFAIDFGKEELIKGKSEKQKLAIKRQKKKYVAQLSEIVKIEDYRLTYIADIDMFRIKKKDNQLIDINFLKENAEAFGIELSNYEERYLAEKEAFEKENVDIKLPNIMREIPNEKIVYLTFDDGPNEHTMGIVNVLKERGVKGTFFLLGNNIYGKEDILKKTYDEGHAIGLHSMTHKYKEVYNSPDSFLNEMNTCNDLVENATGQRTKLIRPPYGSHPQVTEPYRDLVINNGYRIWDWNIDSGDSRNSRITGNDVYNITISQANKFEGPVIILFHDKNNTIEALPKIIDYFLERGYRFEPITEDLLPFNFWKDIRYVN